MTGCPSLKVKRSNAVQVDEILVRNAFLQNFVQTTNNFTASNG